MTAAIVAARCRDNPEAFFQRDGERRREAEPRMRELAARYCQRCPVRTDCRAAAAQLGAEGLWGGDWRYMRHNRLFVLPLLDAGPERPA